jgi:macrolide transport system ATP-binding/permease protein
MNILGCLDRPTSGKYWLDGAEIGSLSKNDRAIVRTAKLGFVFQNFNLLSRTTAVHNVLMPVDYSPASPPLAETYERAHQLLERVGLSERVHHFPSQMSGGQQQRVAIARALVNRPDLLLADEPTGNLDSRTSIEILQMFKELNASGLTIVLVTHDSMVASYADRVIHVADGLVVDGAGPTGIETDPALSGPPRRSSAEHHANGNSNGNGHGDTPSWRSTGVDGGNVAVSEPPVRVHAPSVATKLSPAAEGTSQPKEIHHPSLVTRLMPPVLRTAINALRRNKMRSALTTLGVVIGVGAVIAMVEISTGSKTSLLSSMASMGANNLIVQSGAATSGGVSFGRGSTPTLTPEDAEAIAMHCPSVESVAPVIETRGQLIYGNKNWVPMNIYGTTPTYLGVRDWHDMDEGTMFTDQDVRAANKVCVIGRTLVKELFNGNSPIGRTLRVKNVAVRVLGVLGPKGANMIGMDQDDVVILPWTTVKFRISGNNSGQASAGATEEQSATANTAHKLYPGKTVFFPEKSATQLQNNPQTVRFVNVDRIQAKAASADEIPTAIAQITAVLHDRHRIRDGQADDFNIRDMSEFLKMFSSTSQMMGGLLLIVALISLVVGGVGIMNIMLVSVTERTREIGLRMAVGARSHHILRQFLIEAVVLCLFGGAVGILLGRGASLLVWYTMRWPIEASPLAIAAAFLVSATIGIAFGFYPAWKASRLDPIEALRYE